MRITEYKSDLKLDIPEFVCDKCLGDHISEPFPNGHHFMCLAAMPGSGKTSLAMGLLTTKGAYRQYRKVFHDVYLFMPKHSQSSLKNSPFKNHDEEKIFDTLNYQNLQDVYEKVQASAERDENSLIIFDDMTADLKNHENLKFFMMLINNRRHLRLSIWILVQSYIAIPLNLRKTITDLVMWKPGNKKEYYSLFEELLQMPKDVAEAVTQYTYQKKHDFLFVNTLSGNMYRNFNKLSIGGYDDDDDDFENDSDEG